jgi:hypothetical protein
MRILLDENVDWRLGKGLLGHEVESVQRLGWAEIQNGVLLKKAEETGFEVPMRRKRCQRNSREIWITMIASKRMSWMRLIGAHERCSRAYKHKQHSGVFIARCRIGSAIRLSAW